MIRVCEKCHKPFVSIGNNSVCMFCKGYFCKAMLALIVCLNAGCYNETERIKWAVDECVRYCRDSGMGDFQGMALEENIFKTEIKCTCGGRKNDHP